MRKSTVPFLQILEREGKTACRAHLVSLSCANEVFQQIKSAWEAEQGCPNINGNIRHQHVQRVYMLVYTADLPTSGSTA